MAYSKTSKINLYKFVAVKDPSSSEEGGLDDPKAARALTTNINTNTRAINNLGTTINSLANVLVDIKTINLKIKSASAKTPAGKMIILAKSAASVA